MRKIVYLLVICILFSTIQISLAAQAGYVKVDTGNNHVVALKDDGTVWVWGANADGTQTDRFAPIQLKGLDGIIDIAVDDNMNAVLKSDGSVWCWGDTWDLLSYNSDIPVMLPYLSNIAAINIRRDGGVTCLFSLSKDGKQYKNEEEIDSREPFLYNKTTYDPNLNDPDLKAEYKIFSYDFNDYLGVKYDNTVWLFDGESEELMELKEFSGCRDVAVMAGSYYIVCSDGRLVTLGINQNGKLGNGFSDYVPVPYKLDDVHNAKKVAMDYHSFVSGIYILYNDGSVCLLDSVNSSERLKKVQIDNVSDIVIWDRYILALKNDNTVWMWESINGSENDAMIPRQIPELSDIVSIFSIHTYCGAIDRAGNVYMLIMSGFFDELVTCEKLDGNVFGRVTGIPSTNESIQFLTFQVTVDRKNNAINVFTWRENARIPINSENYFVKLFLDSIGGIDSVPEGSFAAYEFRINFIDGKCVGIATPIEVDPKIVTTEHELSLMQDGTVWQNSDSNYYYLSMQKGMVDGLKNIVSIASNGQTHFAIDSEGSLLCWGLNSKRRSQYPIQDLQYKIIPSEFYGSQTEWKEVVTQVISLNVGKSTMRINNSKVNIPSPPVIRDNRTLIPIREVIEALGGQVMWNDKNQKITVNLSDKKLILTIDSLACELNGQLIKTDVAPQMINEKIYLPLRFVCESVGAKVLWEELAQKITIVY